MVDIYKRMQEDMGHLMTELSSTVTRTSITKTLSNEDADETLTSGTTESINVSINKMETSWDFDKQGEIEGGDALMYTKYNQTINKNDEILYNDRTYQVKNVLNNIINNQIVFKKCNLFLIE